MFKGVWRGTNIPKDNRILILGESHYGDEIIDKNLLTEHVVNTYLNDIKCGSRKRWAQFFDKIALSFGYEKVNVRDFYSKVFFGNYIETFCGIKDNKAKDILALNGNRKQFNNSLFEFVNKERITTIICFSILTYNNLPGMALEETEKKYTVGKIGNKDDVVRECTYSSLNAHAHCDIILEKELQVFGIRHPSSAGGYSPDNVFRFFSEVEGIHWLMQGD